MLLQSHAEGAGSARFCSSTYHATEEASQASPPSPRLRARMFPITSDGGCGLLGVSRRRWLAGRPLGRWLWSHLMRVRGGRGGFITQACGFREHPCYGGDPARWTLLMTYLTFLLWTGCWTSLSLPLRCLPARSRPARNQGHLWQLDHQPVHLRGSDRFDCHPRAPAAWGGGRVAFSERCIAIGPPPGSTAFPNITPPFGRLKGHRATTVLAVGNGKWGEGACYFGAGRVPSS